MQIRARVPESLQGRDGEGMRAVGGLVDASQSSESESGNPGSGGAAMG